VGESTILRAKEPPCEQLADAVRPAPYPVPRLSIVIPCLNERENINILYERLFASLGSEGWEVIFVDDDSTDGTRDAISQLARRDPRIRLIQRIGRRGLSSAVVEGMLSSTADMIAVMDCDLQHDERILTNMARFIQCGKADLVVASRYREALTHDGFDRNRGRISHLATRLAQVMMKVRLSDPMSGFFMMRRDVLLAVARNLSQKGYKILLDITTSLPPTVKIREVSYVFRERQFGDSKLDARVMLDYVELLADKTIGHYVPVRFLMYSAVGSIGVAIHFLVLMLSLAASIGFSVSHALATSVAMVCNYALNNVLTYRDRRRTGWRSLTTGFLLYAAICALGAFANVGVGSILFNEGQSWWIAALAGISVGVVWNFAVSSVVTWPTRLIGKSA